MARLFCFTTNHTRSKWGLYACIWISLTQTVIGDPGPTDKAAWDAINVPAKTNEIYHITYFDEELQDSFNPVCPLEDSTPFKDYTARVYRARNHCFTRPSSLEILKDGKFIFGMHGHDFNIGTNDLKRLNADVTGDGKPNLVIIERYDGAHSSPRIHLFELEPRFRHLQSIDNAAGDFINMDDDPALEIKVRDEPFEYWKSAYAQSPHVAVYLKYQDGAYRFSEELMRKPPLSKKELQAKAARIRDELEWTDPNSMNGPAPIELWHEAVDLAFHGNLEQARILIDLCWPNDIEGKNDALADFLNHLQLSIYWDDILKLSGIS
jgi:hypothetical protein